MKLKDRIAIITGATSGIGEASALLFAQEGAKVTVTGRDEVRGRKWSVQLPRSVVRMKAILDVQQP